MFRMLIVSTATIGLSAALMTAPAIADHKENHNPGGGGGGGGGGDVTFDVTLWDGAVDTGVVVASGEGVEGRGGIIEGITEGGSFPDIWLAGISTPSGDVQADYNDLCGDVVNPVGSSEEIDKIEVMHNFEIDTLTVVVEYTVDSQSFTLLLDGPLLAEADFPPTGETDYGLLRWNNRGGGKGKRNRCGTGFLDLTGVTLEIDPTSP